MAPEFQLKNELKQSTLVALWFMFLTFPVMVIRVNSVERLIEWKWERMGWVGVSFFFLSFLWRYLMRRKEQGLTFSFEHSLADMMALPQFRMGGAAAAGLCFLIYPFIFSPYQINIMTTALSWVILGLGLNIVVGLAGLLDLGYVAFYAVGAYSYALLNHHFDIGFWIALPIGGILGAVFGVILGFPVLRLRGDYLAIVTLGFGEIIRLVLENWNEFSFGPSGISNIDRPGFFGLEFSLAQASLYLYFLMISLVLFTIFIVNRLQDSRIGRAWIALREDDIACQAMGIDKTKTKLMAFGLGATWAGMAGVIFAAKTTFINPASFTFMESAIILSMVVLGGMGSIPGVITGALVLSLLPEYLRAFSAFRMLIFGATMVFMMVFRPQGLIRARRKRYHGGPRPQDPPGAPVSTGPPL